MKGRVYLDHNATTPLRPEAREAAVSALDLIGNPSSVHADGRQARNLLEEARERIAAVLNAKPSQVYFCSGATEAANWLLFDPRGRTLFLNPIEHKCVIEGHRFALRSAVRSLGIDGGGVVDLETVRAALSQPGPKVFAIQAANNETGVLQPLDSILSLAAGHKDTLILCDAVQAPGRLALEPLRQADAFFISAHKFGGPKGIGAAVIRNGDWPLDALIRGGGQERGKRSGTENLAGGAGMAAALEVAVAERVEFAARGAGWRKKLETDLRSIAPDAVIFGEQAERLPNTTCFALPGRSAETLLIAFDLEGIAVSSGSACSSGRVEKSHVLEAMGLAPEIARGAIRVSTGWTTTEADIERFSTALEKICRGRTKRQAA